MKKIFFMILLVFFFLWEYASAHQPRIPEGNTIIVTSPEISKAYYTELQWVPQKYIIDSDIAFPLYVNLLVPDITGQKKDISAVIIKDGDLENPLATLDGTNFEWVKFFEPFGYDTYWQGPTYKGQVDAGSYEIIVSSTENNSTYSLAIGEAELFDFKESMNAMKLVPQIKRDFFNESPLSFILSPMGAGFVGIMLALGFVFGFLYRFILRKWTKEKVRKTSHNINLNGRLLRALIGIWLLLLAITTTWSPLLLFFAGFAFFEAIFSWCGLFAALGKSSCPLE